MPAAIAADEAPFVKPGQIFLTEGREYEVHAISVFNGVVFLQVVDDLDAPEFAPRALFDVVDARIPDDWICNTFPTGPVQLLSGPPFIADSVESYRKVIDRDGAVLTLFWRRLVALERMTADND